MKRGVAEPARQTCPLCGSPVIVHTSDEGTSHYEPVQKTLAGIPIADLYKPLEKS